MMTSTDQIEAVESAGRSASARRQFLTRSTVAAAGFAAAGLFSSQVARAITPALTFADIPKTGDEKILNYALSLEDLEADLYQQAMQRLTTGGTNKLGKKIPGLGLSSKEIDVQYVQEFSVIERQHSAFLRGSLGIGGIRPFKYDFGMQSLNRKGVIDLVYTAEKTGVSAYLGAIPFFRNRKYLRAAGAILGTEARHTAVIAAVLDQLFSEGLTVAPLASNNGGRDMPMTPDAVLASISPFIVAA